MRTWPTSIVMRQIILKIYKYIPVIWYDCFGIWIYPVSNNWYPKVSLIWKNNEFEKYFMIIILIYGSIIKILRSKYNRLEIFLYWKYKYVVLGLGSFCSGFYDFGFAFKIYTFSLQAALPKLPNTTFLYFQIKIFSESSW